MALENNASVKITIDDDVALKAINTVQNAINSLDDKTLKVSLQANSQAIKQFQDQQIQAKIKVDAKELEKIPKNVQVGVTPQTGVSGQPVTSNASGAGIAAAIGASISSPVTLNRQNESLFKQAINLQNKINDLQDRYSDQIQDTAAQLRGQGSTQQQINRSLGQQDANLRKQIDIQKQKLDTIVKQGKAIQQVLNQQNKNITTWQKFHGSIIKFGQSVQRVVKSSLKIAAGIGSAIKISEGIANAYVAYQKAGGSILEKAGAAAQAFANSIPILGSLTKSLSNFIQVTKLGDTIQNLEKAQAAIRQKGKKRAEALQKINKSIKDYIDGVNAAANSFGLSGQQNKLLNIVNDRNKRIKQVMESQAGTIEDKSKQVQDIVSASTKQLQTIQKQNALNFDNSKLAQQQKQRDTNYAQFLKQQGQVLNASIQRGLQNSSALNQQNAAIKKANAKLQQAKNQAQGELVDQNSGFDAAPNFIRVLTSAGQKQINEAQSVRDLAVASAQARLDIINKGITQQAEIEKQIRQRLQTGTKQFSQQSKNARQKKADEDLAKATKQINESIKNQNFIELNPLQSKILQTKKSIDAINKSIAQAADKGIIVDPNIANSKIKQAQKSLQQFAKKFTEQSVKTFNKTLNENAVSAQSSNLSSSKALLDVKRIQDEIAHLQNPQAITSFRSQQIKANQQQAKEQLKIKQQTSLNSIATEKQSALKIAKDRQATSDQLLAIQLSFNDKRKAALRQFSTQAEVIEKNKQLQIARLAKQQQDTQKEAQDKRDEIRKQQFAATQFSTSSNVTSALAGISKKPGEDQIKELKKSNEQLVKIESHLKQIKLNKQKVGS